jgi:ElaB/YqjD/DUF883 family membrane-anchored ribosome-binding protein
MEIYFKNLTEEDTADKLLEDLRTLREDTEELFLATGGKLAQESKEKFLTAVERAKETCLDIKDQAAAGVQSVEQTVEEVVRAYPFSAVGVAFGLGILLGAVMWKR